jgi:hypothetical protein
MAVVNRAGITRVKVDDPALQLLLDRVVELLRTWNGEGANDTQRVITKQELEARLKELGLS